jgi:hypothetical protein
MEDGWNIEWDCELAKCGCESTKFVEGWGIR